MRKILCVFFILTFSNPLQAVFEIQSKTADTTKSVRTIKDVNTPTSMLKNITNISIEAFLTVLFTLIFTIIISYFTGKRTAISSFYPKKIKKGTRKNTVLVIGLGRSGKSCLIKALAKSHIAGKPKLTNDFEIVTHINVDSRLPIYFHFTDYRGQSFKQLIENFIKEQFNPNTLVRYGDINSLVLVVDLFPFRENEKPEVAYTDIDKERIKEHLGQWNRTALDAVFGLLTEKSLKYVCLFINKVDMWESGNTNKGDKHIEKLFASLIEDLQNRVNPKFAQFEVKIGSAIRGDNVYSINNGLQQSLYEFSVPLLKKTINDKVKINER